MLMCPNVPPLTFHTHYFLSCFQKNKMPRKHKKAKRPPPDTDEGESQESDMEEGERSSSPRESEEDSDEDSDSSSTEEDEEEDHKSDAHGPTSSPGALEAYYAAKKRVDAKDVTCVLHPKTLSLYFKKM